MSNKVDHLVELSKMTILEAYGSSENKIIVLMVSQENPAIGISHVDFFFEIYRLKIVI